MVRLALVLTLAILVAGCGGKSAPAGPARLSVVQVIEPGSPLPIEGAYAYVRVERPDGSSVVERRLSDARPPSVTLSLPADDYRLVSWQRTCDGNCGTLDPPSDGCNGSFTLDDGERLAATITVRYGSGCRIAFR